MDNSPCQTRTNGKLICKINFAARVVIDPLELQFVGPVDNSPLCLLLQVPPDDADCSSSSSWGEFSSCEGVLCAANGP